MGLTVIYMYSFSTDHGTKTERNISTRHFEDSVAGYPCRHFCKVFASLLVTLVC